jgi:uncharacterized repeat protein (TIGR01451 family)
MPRLLLVLTLVAAAAFAAPASANHLTPGPATTTLAVQPTQADGNQTCAQLLGAGAFLFEHKQDPVVDTGATPIQLSHAGKSGTLSIDEYDTVAGEKFDFTTTGDFVVLAVFSKGGEHGNLFDYRPAGASADTGLHTPVNPSNGKFFFEGSHNTFCLGTPTPPPPPVLAVAKTPDNGTVAAGSDISFGIAVTNNGPGTATNVTLDDALPAGFAWSDNSADCTVTAGQLHCDIGDLAEGASFSVTVSAPTTTDNCGVANNPDATADADNADPVSDSGSVTVTCPTPLQNDSPPPLQQVDPVQEREPIRVVAPQRAQPGSARLIGPTRCVRGSYAVRIVGQEIQSVAFRRGGRAVKAKRSGQVFTIRLAPSASVDRITARVTFTSASGTTARTFRIAVQRCAQRAVRPSFTG